MGPYQGPVSQAAILASQDLAPRFGQGRALAGTARHKTTGEQAPQCGGGLLWLRSLSRQASGRPRRIRLR